MAALVSGQRSSPEHAYKEENSRMLNWLRRPDAKELGNSAFKEKNLDEAVLQYTRGLERCQGTAQTEERSKLLANRSAAHAKLGDYEAALSDAEEAARLQPDWPKAWARKGKALTCLQRHKAAASSYARGLECALTLMQKNDERHERELEALQKQAKTASDSYMALLGETETLKRQLEDYTLMFGERETGGKAKAG